MISSPGDPTIASISSVPKMHSPTLVSRIPRLWRYLTASKKDVSKAAAPTMGLSPHGPSGRDIDRAPPEGGGGRSGIGGGGSESGASIHVPDTSGWGS